MKPKNCLDNLSYCKAMCCRAFSFELTPTTKSKLRRLLGKNGVAYINITGATDDMKLYWGYHKDVAVKGNTLVIRNPHGKIYKNHVVLFKKCEQLSPALRCKVHNTPEKPVICVEGHSINKRTVMFPKECIYKPEDIVGEDLVLEWEKRR